MFLHLGWGGVYMNREEEAAKIRACFALADGRVEQAEVVGKLRGNGRLTVVVSDCYGSYWVAPGRKRTERDESHEALTGVLREATAWLETKKPKRAR